MRLHFQKRKYKVALWSNDMLQVQHPGLRDTYAADVATVALLVNCVRLIFPEFDYSWLVKEIKRTLPKASASCLSGSQKGNMTIRMHCASSLWHLDGVQARMIITTSQAFQHSARYCFEVKPSNYRSSISAKKLKMLTDVAITFWAREAGFEAVSMSQSSTTSCRPRESWLWST